MLVVETRECVPLLIPRTFGDYTAHERIGRGSTCAVIEASDHFTGRDYAVKVMSLADLKSRGIASTVEHELMILRRLSHRHIIAFREFIRHGDLLFFVTEHCSGGTLFSWISEGRLLQKCTMKRLFYEIALAVQYLHSHGIEHNGIEPKNILISASGSAKLASFGHATGPLLATHCDTPENLLYAAPELLRRKASRTQKSDIWALGILLCVMATGAFPFRENDKDKVARQIRARRLKYPRNMDRDVEALVRRMTKTNPDDRPAIDAILEGSFFDEFRETKPGKSQHSVRFAAGTECDSGRWCFDNQKLLARNL
jgi:serine/threonine protein kinase